MNHNVTRVLEEKVDDIPDAGFIEPIESIDGMGLADGIPAEDGRGILMFTDWYDRYGNSIDIVGRGQGESTGVDVNAAQAYRIVIGTYVKS